jgi:hypothetical protein
MDMNCHLIVTKYLLNQNPLYAFSFPISILVGILFFGLSKAYSWSDNSYVNQILIPILAFLLSMVIIDMISKMMINKHEMHELMEMCEKWKEHKQKEMNQHPAIKKIMKQYMNKEKNIEEFTIGTNSFNFNLPNSPVEVAKVDPEQTSVQDNTVPMANIEPEMLETKSSFYFDSDSSQVQLQSQCIENSNCCNLCSGSNSNPCNLVAPIPGPQWLPRSAAAVQQSLKNGQFTKNRC